jgi:hypothetical protein
MLKLKSKDGETVKGGTYWSYVAPTLGLVALGVLPEYLKGFYGSFAGKLVEAYVVFGCLFIVMVLGGLSVMVYRDRAALSHSMKVFRFRPDEAVTDSDVLAPVKVQSNRIENE